MSDKDRNDEKTPIQDEKLDKVSGGFPFSHPYAPAPPTHPGQSSTAHPPRKPHRDPI